MKLHLGPRTLSIAYAFCLMTSTLFPANAFSPIVEAQGWTLGSPGALAPIAANIDGVDCLRFPCTFATNTIRAAWDRPLKADLTGVSQIVFRLKVSDHKKISQFSVYLKSGKGYYLNFAAIYLLNDGWNTVSIPRTWFNGTEGNCDGWNAIDGIRLSPFQSETGDFSLYIASVELIASEPGENLLANSGFEAAVIENFPDSWGPGHWGLGAPAWVADTPAWRARWGTVTDEVHSGSRAMRIVGDTNTAGLRLYSTRVILDADRDYTFSAWLKSDRDAYPVTMSIDGIGGRPVSVGKTWQRYTFIGAEKKPRARMCTIIPSANGTLWIDDVKLEQGNTVTDWKPARIDASPAAVVRPLPRMTSPEIFSVQPLSVATTVSIDEHRRVLVNGKPFIPFATGWESVPTPEMIRDTARAGCNAITWCATSRVTVDAHRSLLDAAKNNGLMAIVWFHRNVSATAMREHITQLKDHPAVLAWYVYDEPAVITSEIQGLYDMARTVDPMHPTYLNYTLYEENKLGDIASMDQYPIPEYMPAIMAGLSRTMEFSASRAGKPSWIWLQGSGYAYFKSREPTGPEAECMTYCSLINGVRGIKWFAQKPLTAELWNAMQHLAREVRTLTPVLYSLDDAPNVNVSSKDIDFVVKKYSGDTYIIAVNTLPSNVPAVFTLSQGIMGKAEVMFEGRSIAMSGAVLKDGFLGYQRHVYRLPSR
ncbi:MAG: hypothetical protein AABZ39_11155 [Spirochaetota bacterium]